MPTRGRYKRVPRVLTAEDKAFIKSVSRGEKRTKSFRDANPEHPTVKKYMDIVRNGGDPEERQRLRASIGQLAKDKIQTKHIQSALVTYQNKMNVFSDKSLDTAIDLVENARSEKVRADLAIEGMRHRVGTPVQKVQVQQETEIFLTFGAPHKDDDVSDLIDIDENGNIE